MNQTYQLNIQQLSLNIISINEAKFGQILFMKIDLLILPKLNLTLISMTAKNAKGGKNSIKLNLWNPIATCLA